MALSAEINYFLSRFYRLLLYKNLKLLYTKASTLLIGKVFINKISHCKLTLANCDVGTGSGSDSIVGNSDSPRLIG